MRKHLISAVLMLAVLVSGVTAKVTRHARADGSVAPATAPSNPEQYWAPTDVLQAIPRLWYPQVLTEIHGVRVTFTRHVGFDNEDQCLTFLQSAGWKVERQVLAFQILAEDEDADWVGEATCVEQAVPPRKA